MRADLEKLKQLITPPAEDEALASIRAAETLQTFAAISASENRELFSAEAARAAFSHIKPRHVSSSSAE